MTTDEPAKQPQTVTYAIFLLSASWALGFVAGFIEKYTGFTESFDTLGIVLVISIYLVMVAYIYMLTKGVKWVRTTFVILYFVAFGLYPILLYPVSIYGLSINFDFLTPFEYIVSIIQFIMQIAAIILLFLPASNRWYNLKK